MLQGKAPQVEVKLRARISKRAKKVAEQEMEKAVAVDTEPSRERAMTFEASESDDGVNDSGPVVEPESVSVVLTGPVPYRDSPEFQKLRAIYERELKEMKATTSPEVAAERLVELERRSLTPAHIDAALRYRQKTMQDNMADEAAELHLPPETATSPVAVQRVHDYVLQLYRMLHQRQVDVLRGNRLPRLGSVFSKVKLA